MTGEDRAASARPPADEVHGADARLADVVEELAGRAARALRRHDHPRSAVYLAQLRRIADMGQSTQERLIGPVEVDDEAADHRSRAGPPGLGR